MGDSQQNSDVASNIVNKVVQKMTELYGSEWYNQVEMICHMGDTVYLGIILSSYMSEHFTPYAPISANIPIMAATGNHEFENSYFYNYRKVEDIAGPEGEKYFSFDIGTMRFIFLNTNISTSTETTWLQGLITDAQTNANLDWVFTFGHHPAYSEIWPDGNLSWMQSTVLPTLASCDKAALIAGGHTHAYERGITADGHVTTLISGGAGGTLDRWGMYSNQTDYNNTVKSLDQYNFILVDVDLANKSYTATMYSLGNSNKSRDNEIMDQWTYNGLASPETAPITEAQSAATGSQMILTASPATHSYTEMSTRYQISANINFTSTIADITRQKTDVYSDTGSPLWQPVDQNAALDIWRDQVPAGALTNGNTYYWRVKSRDASEKWSEWSSPASFIMQTQTPRADFKIHDSVVEINVPVYFVESSIGIATSYSWDLNGDSLMDSNQRDPNWTYTTPGTYNVTLMVMIGGQQYTTTKQVTVNGGSLDSPENLKITHNAGDIHLRWDPVSGATGYRVYYFTDPVNPSSISWVDSSTNEITLSGMASENWRFFRVTSLR